MLTYTNFILTGSILVKKFVAGLNLLFKYLNKTSKILHYAIYDNF